MSSLRSIAVIGAAAAAVVFLLFEAQRLPTSHADERPSSSELPAIQSDLQTLKDKAPDQAHAMVSVAYHFNNLWFAGEAKNWPLAEFYWNETRSHLRWAVRIIPIRKDKAGYEIKLAEILDAMENTPLKQLQEAIATKDHDKFIAAYKFSLETCYACHKAADKPFLKPRIPEYPAEPTINFDPQADWPK
jgi:hypothetical protein